MACLLVRGGRLLNILAVKSQSRILPAISGRSLYKSVSNEPFQPIPNRYPTWTTASAAVEAVNSDNKVFIHGGAATPIPLVEALTKHGKSANLHNVELLHIITEGPAAYSDPEYEGIFRTNSMFISDNIRESVNLGKSDFIPIFLSEIPHLFRRKIISLDVALISVSPPDKHGFCTLGVSVETARAAIQNAKYIIALCNPQQPRTFGDGVIHQSHIDAMVEGDYPLPELEVNEWSKEHDKIGKLIAENLVSDGATLQIGIGSIPNAVLTKLTNHRDLGVHSEMISDGIVDLVANGNITNAKKSIQQGKIVSSFAMGSKRVYEFLNDNPFVVMCDTAYTNNVHIIARNPYVTAINSCIEVDTTGQVCADSIGCKMYSGVGGQLDFIRGASLSHDGNGRPIIAMTSTTKDGESKIVPLLKEGGGVVTTRAHVHYIVTEYGIAYLFGKNLRQRAYELIRVAHPKHRETLEMAAFERLKVMPSPD